MDWDAVIGFGIVFAVSAVTGAVFGLIAAYIGVPWWASGVCAYLALYAMYRGLQKL